MGVTSSESVGKGIPSGPEASATPGCHSRKTSGCFGDHDHGQGGQGATAAQATKERPGIVFAPDRPAEGELGRRKPGE